MILRTIERLRKRCHEFGPLEALEPAPRTHVSRKPALDDDQEARLVHLACSEPPPGCARWTLKLLAGKLVQRFEWHYTPKHGSWLNMAENEIGIFARTVLRDRIGSKEEFCTQSKAGCQRRNDTSNKTIWKFTTEDDRIKMKGIYPTP